MKLVYVTHSTVVEKITAFVVKDDADLSKQLLEREATFKAIPFAAKPAKDKQGNTIMHQLSKDWPPYP